MIRDSVPPAYALLYPFELYEDKKYQSGGEYRQQVHSKAYCHAYYRHHPYACRRGEAAHRAFHLDYGSGAEESLCPL